jgi:hypothetical protein
MLDYNTINCRQCYRELPEEKDRVVVQTSILSESTKLAVHDYECHVCSQILDRVNDVLSDKDFDHAEFLPGTIQHLQIEAGLDSPAALLISLNKIGITILIPPWLIPIRGYV